MFAVDDDFDLDVDFLEGAFSVECEKNKSRPAEYSIKSKAVNRPLQGVNNGQNNKPYENHKQEKSTFEFLANRKSNEENFFSNDIPKSSNLNNVNDFRAVSPLGVRSEAVTRGSKQVRQRKFPGPAGLLPERTSNTSFIAAEEYLSTIQSEEDSFCNFEDKEVLSQASSKFFEEPGSAWRTMVDDLGPQGIELISAVNLGAVRIKQSRFGFKVPFLAVCVHNIDCSLPDPSLLLKDKIDEMHGTLHRNVWEDWKDEIVVGSVLVLRNTGVISAGTSTRRFFLNITANNIVTIYTPKQDSGVKITQIQSSSSMNATELLQEWERVMTQTRQQQLGSDTTQSRQLYSTYSPLRPSGLPTPSPVPFYSSPVSLSSNRGITPPKRPIFRPRFPHHQQRIPNPQQRTSLVAGTPRLPVQQTLAGHQGLRLQGSSETFHTQCSPSGHPNVFKKLSPNQNNTPMQMVSASKTPFCVKTPVMSFHNPSPHRISKNEVASSRGPNKSGFSGSSLNCGRIDKAEESMIPVKKPKVLDLSRNLPKMSSSSIFSVDSDNDKSVVDDTLDGIDTDLLFDDF